MSNCNDYSDGALQVAELRDYKRVRGDGRANGQRNLLAIQTSPILLVFMNAGCRNAAGKTFDEAARKVILKGRYVCFASAAILLSALVSLKNELRVITVSAQLQKHKLDSEAQVKSSVSRTLGLLLQVGWL